MKSARQEILSYISDAHKDAYGFRPRGLYAGYNLKELYAEADRLSDAVGEAIKEEEAAQESARASWEASVAKTIELGAGTREAAVRWLLDAEGLLEECSDGYANYVLGVGYGYNLETGEVAY